MQNLKIEIQSKLMTQKRFVRYLCPLQLVIWRLGIFLKEKFSNKYHLWDWIVGRWTDGDNVASFLYFSKEHLVLTLQLIIWEKVLIDKSRRIIDYPIEVSIWKVTASIISIHYLNENLKWKKLFKVFFCSKVDKVWVKFSICEGRFIPILFKIFDLISWESVLEIFIKNLNCLGSTYMHGWFFTKIWLIAINCTGILRYFLGHVSLILSEAKKF